MLGHEFFRSDLGVGNDFSPLPYLSGSGTLRRNGESYALDWELAYSTTGRYRFVLTSSTPTEGIEPDTNELFTEYSFHGTTGDNSFTIAAERVIVHTQSFSTFEQFRQRYFCNFSQLRLTRNSASNAPTSVQALVSNLDFIGTQRTFNSRGGSSLDHFTADVDGRTITFRHGAPREQLLRLIRSGQIDRGLIGEISLPFQDKDAVNSVLDLLDSLCWMTTFLTMNRTMPLIVRFISEEETCEVIVRDLRTSPHRDEGIVDNFLCKGGLTVAVRSRFNAFRTLETSLELRRVIDMTQLMLEQSHVEFRLAALLLCMEFFLTKFLTQRNVQPGDNVQQKLRQANRHLRFISADLLDDELRDEIRNPLFHLGQIVGRTPVELFRVFQRYYDLLVRMILVELGWDGLYISPISNNAEDTPVPRT